MSTQAKGHVHHLCADYALGLLSQQEFQSVARHVAGCEACQGTLRQQRSMIAAVNNTIGAEPLPASLANPARWHGGWLPRAVARPARRLAALALAAVLLSAGYGWLASQPGHLGDGRPAAVTLAATAQPSLTPSTSPAPTTLSMRPQLATIPAAVPPARIAAPAGIEISHPRTE